MINTCEIGIRLLGALYVTCALHHAPNHASGTCALRPLQHAQPQASKTKHTGSLPAWVCSSGSAHTLSALERSAHAHSAYTCYFSARAHSAYSHTLGHGSAHAAQSPAQPAHVKSTRSSGPTLRESIVFEPIVPRSILKPHSRQQQHGLSLDRRRSFPMLRPAEVHEHIQSREV